jgi:UDP-glucose 4-epimerase
VLSELLIEKVHKGFYLNFVNLQDFNVASSFNNKLQDDCKYNLIFVIIDQIGYGVNPKIFENVYSTPDGIAIHNFIRVANIANAHLASLSYLNDGRSNQIFNIGTGTGTLALEIVTEIILQIESDLVPNFVGGKEGDTGIVVENSLKAEHMLRFKAKHDLAEMVA